MSSITSDPAANRLLAALPQAERARFVDGCDVVELVNAETLAEAGEPTRHVYFPMEGFISLTTKPTEDSASLEVALVGNEGMLGSSLILGVDASPLRALVRGKGSALRMDAAAFLGHLEQGSALQRELRRYLHVVMGQLAQMAVCTRFHVVEARLARWLLQAQDRVQSNGFHITQEFMACMLGVRRVGITKAATSLQNRNLIRYHRGDITIVDRPGLEAAACGCYDADKSLYARTMGWRA